MKKISLLFAVLCLVASNAVAQLEKGNIMLGATSTIAMGGGWDSELMSLYFAKTKYKQGTTTEDYYKTTAYNFLPKAGYFIMDNLVAGLEVVVTGYIEKDIEDDDTWKESLLAVGPFVRYYYPLDKIYPFAEIEALFGTEKDTWLSDEDKSSIFLFSGSLGAAVPLGEKVTFDVQAGYTRVTDTWKDEAGDEESKYITGGFDIRLGFSIYL
jgi:hypothetical protein